MEIDSSQLKGHVVVVMAPMGSGKGTIIKEVLTKHPDIYHTVSCTSRDKRPGEVDGQHYYFLTRDVFLHKLEKGEFLEWAEFAGNLYGTLRSEIVPRLADCQVVLVEIELQGVEQLIELIPRDHMTVTYIEAGGWEVLRERAEARAPMSETELEARYQRYLIEKQAKPLADVVIDNSSSVEMASDSFEQVIADAKKKCKL